MEDLNTKRKSIGDGDITDYKEISSQPKKPTLVKPLPMKAQPNLPFGSGSSFQPWKRPFGGINNGHNHGIINNARATLTSSNNATKPLHRLATCSNSYDMNRENLIEKNPINNEVIGSDGGDANDDGISDDNEVPKDKPSSGCNTKPEIMDPKILKRMMSNRASAQRSRDKRNAYMAELEEKAKTYEEKIELTHPKIEAQKRIVHSLKIEQHKLKLLMAAREKQRVLQEAAIEKNRAEAERLRKLNTKLAAEAQAKILNMTAALHLTSNSNSNSLSLYPPSLPLGAAPFISNNINSPTQALNGEGTLSIAQVDNSTAQQSQNQSHMMMMMMAATTSDNRTRSTIPNLNLVVKSEPDES